MQVEVNFSVSEVWTSPSREGFRGSGVFTTNLVNAACHAIADAQEQQIHGKTNKMLHHLIKQSLADWSHSPSENGGRNAEVQAALSSLPPGLDESKWLDSKDAIDLHSLLIRTGKHQVFGETPELEAFSLMVEFPLAIYLPGHWELFPKSTEYDGCNDYLLGICIQVDQIFLSKHRSYCYYLITYSIPNAKVLKRTCQTYYISS